MAIRVRVAAPVEYESLRQLYRDWGYAGEIRDSDVVYAADADGRAVGIVRRTVEHETTMLRGMQVDPAFHHQGIGSQLLAAFAADVAGVDVYCIPFAHLTAFYGQIGFAVVHESIAPPFLANRVERYRAQGHDVLIMRLLGEQLQHL